MKKYLLIAVAALAMTGCKVEVDSDYDLEATREQVRVECDAFGGKASTIQLNWRVDKRPWTGTCINPNTGNEFRVYVKGVLK